MQHIGVFIDFAPAGGGAFQYARTLVKQLSRLEGIKVTVAFTQGNWINIFAEDPVDVIPLSGGRFVLKAGKFLLQKKILPLRLWKRIAFLHPYTRKLNAIGAGHWIFPCQDFWSFFLGQSKSVVSIHDLMHRYERRFEEVGKEFEQREFLYSNICKSASKILVDSELGKIHVHESYGFPLSDIFVLPYTVPDYIHGIEKEPVGIKFESGSFFYYPAQFWSHKNHLGLLKAILIARSKGHNFNVIFSGSKKNGLDGILAFIDANGLGNSVQIIGYADDAEVVWLYQHSMGLVMPTFFGPTNIPPLEAMALGVPMAISGIYGMPEQSGEAALYFNPKSPEDIAESMIKLLDSAVRARLIASSKLQLEKISEEKFRNRLQEFVSEL